MKKLGFLSALFLGLCVSQVSADSAQDLQKAKSFYSQGKYLDAAPLFGSVVESRSSSKLHEEALAYLAETQIRLGRSEKSLNRVVQYEFKYPQGQYTDVIGFVRARLDLYEGIPGQAAARLMQLLANSKDQALSNKVSLQLQEILESATLTIEELNKIIQLKEIDASVVYNLRLNFAQRLNSEGRYKSSAYYYESLIRDFPNQSATLTPVLEEVKAKGLGNGVILVIAPMNGPYADFGEMVAKGVALGFEETNPKSISYQLVDSRGEPAYTVSKIQNLVKVENVIGVIGPIMSDNAAAVASWMSAATPEIPMITPTATDRHIAWLGSNIYQLNVPVFRMATEIADYTSRCLKKKRSVIIAPRSSYGRIMSEGYTETFEKAGGEIVTVVFYNEGETDYKKVFNILRHLKLQEYKNELAVKYKSDDLNSVLSGKAVAKFMEDSTVTFESVFIAASDPSDAALLSKQLHFAKIKATIVGSSGWNGKNVIRQGGRDIADVVFSVGFTDNTKEVSFQNFAKAFRKRWNQYPDPDKVSGLSYDAMRIMLTGISKGKENLVETLQTLKKFNGVYGAIKLNSKGENVNSQLIKIENFKFTPINTCVD